ncbi:hypothetical protein D7X74_15240 [Corallococcus sp. CA047B]|uniref:hypothetical protein n=1 Tax=Corallococcus sp. CA047B TaxID=2316729 RepID=UPI000EA2FCD9|nr:hypothetical protein [Corallococcus sp. CA047B]RKH16525.1 hypothetical protein D7X74_15240 [Corallococcus sp. CA047B]
MQLLTASPISDECRRYWALGGIQAALDALVQDSRAGRISTEDADALALNFPLLALEDSARRTAFSRLQDATQDDRFMDAVLHVTRGDLGLVPLLQRRAAQYWMRLVYDATGQTSHTVAPALAESLRGMELHGYTCDDVRLPGRALHLVVPPDAGLELPDNDRVRWTATDLLIVEESEPRVWRLCLEAPTGEGRSAHVLAMALPRRTALDAAMAQHAERAARGADWRPLWTWALGAVLSLAPPTSRA